LLPSPSEMCEDRQLYLSSSCQRVQVRNLLCDPAANKVYIQNLR
jgi:hypothetical protein